MSRRNPTRASRNHYGTLSQPPQQPAAVAAATQPFIMRKISTTHQYLLADGFALELRDMIFDHHLQHQTCKITISPPGQRIRYTCSSPFLSVSKQLAAEFTRRLRVSAPATAKSVHAKVVDFNFRPLQTLLTKQLKPADLADFDTVRRKLTVGLRIENIFFENERLDKWIAFVEETRRQQGARALSVGYAVECVPTGPRRADFVQRINEMGLSLAQAGSELEKVVKAFGDWWEMAELLGESESDGDGYGESGSESGSESEDEEEEARAILSGLL